MPPDKVPSMRMLFEAILRIDPMSPELQRMATALPELLSRPSTSVRSIQSKLPPAEEQQQFFHQLKSGLPATDFDTPQLLRRISAVFGSQTPKVATRAKAKGRGRKKGDSPGVKKALKKIEALGSAYPGNLTNRQWAQKLDIPQTTYRRAVKVWMSQKLI